MEQKNKQGEFKLHPTLIEMQKKNHWCVATKQKIPVKLNGQSDGWQYSNSSYEMAKSFSKSNYARYPYHSVILDYGLACIDIDKCLKDGVLCREAQKILNFFPGCYTEISSSGTGLHIYFYLSKQALEHQKLKVDAVSGKNKYYKSKVKLEGKGEMKIESLEFYYKSRSKQIICTEKPFSRKSSSPKTILEFEDIQAFLEKYMRTEAYKKNPNPTASEEDYGDLKLLLSQTNGNEKLAIELFRKAKQKGSRKGEHKDKWNREDYIHLTVENAKNDLINDLEYYNKTKKSSLSASNAMKYFSIGEGFLKAIQNDMPYFKKNKNLLFCFIKLLWETNRQYAQGNVKTKQPFCYVKRENLPRIFCCQSPESGGKKGIDKSLRIVQQLEDVGFISYTLTQDTQMLKIFFRDFFDKGKTENGNFEYHKKFMRVSRRIFKTFFEIQGQKAEKLDFLLFLYGNTEHLSRDELRLWIRNYYFVVFGYWHEKKNAMITPRYDIREQDLATALNITTSTVSKYLTSLQDLGYIFCTRNGRNIYERGIFISMCSVNSMNFKKYQKDNIDAILDHHDDLKKCSKIRIESYSTCAPITKEDIWDLRWIKRKQEPENTQMPLIM